MSTSSPPFKKQKLAKFSAPANIDESFFAKKMTANVVDPVNSPIKKTTTHDACFQTKPNWRRSNDNLLMNRSLEALMESGRNPMIQSLHDTMSTQLKTLFSAIKQNSSKLQNIHADAGEKSNSDEFRSAIILIDHI